MDDAVFRAFCLGIEKLSVRQIRELGEMLRTLDARIEVLAKIDRRRESIDICLHCGRDVLQRWGETRTGLQRFRCKSCGRTFSSATGSALDRVRQPEKFHQVVDDMLTLVPSSCRRLGEKLGLDKMTIWRWRKRIIETITGIGGTDFGGIVEADEKLFRESRKGSREWVRHERNPSLYPAPNRMRWEDYERLKLPSPARKFQIPVLTISDRSGARRADMLPNRQAGSLVAVLARHVGPDAVLCSDGDPAYRVFAQSQAIPHYQLNAKTGPRVIQKAFHIQTINNLHSRFETFMKPFCGPATKNLPGYAAWFIAKLIADAQAANSEVWRRLLAT
jgi:transposase-like protein